MTALKTTLHLRRDHDLAAISILLCLVFVSAVWANQVRSPHSRVASDMRSLATALESYHIDENSYPPPAEGHRLNPALTTPVAYITQIPEDVFKRRVFPPEPFWSYVWLTPIPLIVVVIILVFTAIFNPEFFRRNIMMLLVLAAFLALFAAFLVPDPLSSRTYSEENDAWTEDYYSFHYYANPEEEFWVLQSLGPDGLRDLEDLATVPAQNTELFLTPLTYDPTNGSMSSGDLFRSNRYE